VAACAFPLQGPFACEDRPNQLSDLTLGSLIHRKPNGRRRASQGGHEVYHRINPSWRAI